MATQRSTIEVFFRALGHTQVQAAMRAISGTLNQSTRWGLSFVRSIGGLAPAFNLARSGAAMLSGGLQTASISAAALVGSVYGLKKAFEPLYDANRELGSTVLALRALNDEISKTKPIFSADKSGTGLRDIGGKNARQTADDLAYLNKVANDHGVSIRLLSKDYLGLKASTANSAVSLNSMRETFAGVADAGLVLGLSSEQLSRANTALQQIAGKGQLYAEELRGQLAESIPGAVPMVARAFGVSVEKLNKMIAAGQISAKEFFEKFGKQLKKEYGDAAKSMANTTSVAAGRLANAWYNAKVLIASGRLDETFAHLINAATQLITTLSRNGAWQRFGARLADSLDRVAIRFDQLVAEPAKFERVLNSVANGFDWLVRSGIGVVDLMGQLKGAFSGALGIIDSWGVKLPSVETVLSSIGVTASKLISTLQTGQFTDNPFANYLAGVASVAIELGKALVRAAGGATTFDSIGDAVQYAAHWMGQLSMAIHEVSTGERNSRMDGIGEGLADNIRKAVNIARELFAILKNMANWAITNRDTIASFFAGALDVIKGAVDVGKTLTGVLKHLGINASFGYILGAYFIASKIPGVAWAINAAFGAVVKTIIKLGARLLGVTAAAEGVAAAAGTASAAASAAAAEGAAAAGSAGAAASGAAGAVEAAGAAGAARSGVMASRIAMVGRLGLVGLGLYATEEIIRRNRAEIGGGAQLLVGQMKELGGEVLSLIPGLKAYGDQVAKNGNSLQQDAVQLRNLMQIKELVKSSDAYKALRDAGIGDKHAMDIAWAPGNYGFTYQDVNKAGGWKAFLKAQQRMAAESYANDNYASGLDSNSTGSPSARFNTPINLQFFLEGGKKTIEVVGNSDDAKYLEQIASMASRNRASQTPAWAGG